MPIPWGCSSAPWRRSPRCTRFCSDLARGSKICLSHCGMGIFSPVAPTPSRAKPTKDTQGITSLSAGKAVDHWEINFPPVHRKLATLDWEIMRLLMADPERKPFEVARELRISTRTATRRVNDMMSSYAFFFIPVVNLRKLGGVPCQLMVEYAQANKHILDEAVSSRFERIVFRDMTLNTHSVFGILCANISEGEEVSNWIRNQPGVTSVRLNIVEEPLHAYEWLAKQIEGQSISTKSNSYPTPIPPSNYMTR